MCAKYCIGAITGTIIAAGSAITTTYITTRSAKFDTIRAYNLWFLPVNLYSRIDKNRISIFVVDVNKRGDITKTSNYTTIQLLRNTKNNTVDVKICDNSKP